jgi:protocatechuate 3,4-dioxygenase beta subunit
MMTRLAGVVLAICALSACEADDRPSASGVTSPPPVGCVGAIVGEADAGSVVKPGPTDGLPPSKARGEPLVLAAVVLDPACRPASGASLDIWHTDADGYYRPEGTEACCYYRSAAQTDHNGRFRLETIRPGRYNTTNAPPAHIHLEIRHPSGQLQTEFVFPTGARGDPVDGTTPVALVRRGDTWYGEVVLLLKR